MHRLIVFIKESVLFDLSATTMLPRCNVEHTWAKLNMYVGTVDNQCKFFH